MLHSPMLTDYGEPFGKSCLLAPLSPWSRLPIFFFMWVLTLLSLRSNNASVSPISRKPMHWYSHRSDIRGFASKTTHLFINTINACYDGLDYNHSLGIVCVEPIFNFPKNMDVLPFVSNFTLNSEVFVLECKLKLLT